MTFFSASFSRWANAAACRGVRLYFIIIHQYHTDHIHPAGVALWANTNVWIQSWIMTQGDDIFLTYTFEMY